LGDYLAKNKMYHITKNSGVYDVFPNPEAAQEPARKLGCFAVYFPVKSIYTDTARFQNRTNAFSELSADAVANNYDKNKFDAIVIWEDKAQGKYFVLSGHSRLEGMKRLQAKVIPVRFFEGSEAEAIQFARVDANRSANVENLVEDLKAYILMRDGDEKRKLKPAKKNEIERIFKGKHSKLEAYSYLNSEGLFMQALQADNKSEFPHLEVRALWVGELRKKYGEEFSNTYEDDAFNFIFSDAKHNKMPKEEFMELVEKRISWGEDRIFPECSEMKCTTVENVKERGAMGEMYKRLNQIQKDLDLLRERYATSKNTLKVHTDPEKEVLQKVANNLKEEQKRIKRDLKITEDAPGLFGFEDNFRFETKDFYFQKVISILQKLKIKRTDIVDVVMNRYTTCFGSGNEYSFVGFTKKTLPITFYCVYKQGKFVILELALATEEEIKFIYCNG